MKTLPAAMFGFGVLISFAAFLGDHAAEIPVIIKFVAPEYSRLQAGIDTLQKERRLLKTDTGYAEISQLIIDEACKQNNIQQNPNLGLEVESIATLNSFEVVGFPTGDQTFLADDIRSFITSKKVTLTGSVSNLVERKYHAADLVKRSEDLKSPKVLQFCMILFFIGTVLEVVAFWMDSRDENPKEVSTNACRSGQSCDEAK